MINIEVILASVIHVRGTIEADRAVVVATVIETEITIDQDHAVTKMMITVRTVGWIDHVTLVVTVIHGKTIGWCSLRIDLFSFSSSDVRDRNQATGRKPFSHLFGIRLSRSNLDEPRDDQQEGPRERPRLALQPRTKPVEEVQPLSGSSSSVNNVAANVSESPNSHVEQTSSTNKWTRRAQNSSSNDHPDDHEQQESHESNEDSSQANASDESTLPKPSRGAGASIFGGAKPVDTTAKELEIEKKLKESQVISSETTGDTEDRGPSSR